MNQMFHPNPGVFISGNGTYRARIDFTSMCDSSKENKIKSRDDLANIRHPKCSATTSGHTEPHVIEAGQVSASIVW